MMRATTRVPGPGSESESVAYAAIQNAPTGARSRRVRSRRKSARSQTPSPSRSRSSNRGWASSRTTSRSTTNPAPTMRTSLITNSIQPALTSGSAASGSEAPAKLRKVGDETGGVPPQRRRASRPFVTGTRARCPRFPRPRRTVHPRSGPSAIRRATRSRGAAPSRSASSRRVSRSDSRCAAVIGGSEPTRLESAPCARAEAGTPRGQGDQDDRSEREPGERTSPPCAIRLRVHVSDPLPSRAPVNCEECRLPGPESRSALTAKPDPLALHDAPRDPDVQRARAEHRCGHFRRGVALDAHRLVVVLELHGLETLRNRPEHRARKRVRSGTALVPGLPDRAAAKRALESCIRAPTSSGASEMTLIRIGNPGEGAQAPGRRLLLLPHGRAHDGGGNRHHGRRHPRDRRAARTGRGDDGPRVGPHSEPPGGLHGGVRTRHHQPHHRGCPCLGRLRPRGRARLGPPRLERAGAARFRRSTSSR